MGRTRLFHTVVIVGSGLLANCDKGTPPKGDVNVKVAPDPIRIMAAPPPDPPRIQAMTDPIDAAVPVDAAAADAPKQHKKAPRIIRIVAKPSHSDSDAEVFKKL